MPHTKVCCKLMLLSTILISTGIPAHAILKEDPADLLAQQRKSAPLFPHTHADLVEYAKQFGESHVYELSVTKPTGRYICNAVRVSKNTVLTAGHCVEGAYVTRVNGKDVGGCIVHPRSLFSNQYPDLAALWLPDEDAHLPGLVKAIEKGAFSSFSIKGKDRVAFAVSIQDTQDDVMLYSHYKDTILSHENKGPIGMIVYGDSGGGLFAYEEEKWKPVGITAVSFSHKQGWARIVPEEVEVMESILKCKVKEEPCNQDDIFKVLIDQHETWLTNMLDGVGILDYNFSALKSYRQYLERNQHSLLLESFNDMMTRRTIGIKADDIRKLDNSVAFREFYAHSPLGMAVYDISMMRGIKSHESDMSQLSSFIQGNKEYLGRYNLFHDLIVKTIINYIKEDPRMFHHAAFAMNAFLDMIKQNKTKHRFYAYKFIEVIKNTALEVQSTGASILWSFFVRQIGDSIYHHEDVRSMYYDLIDNIHHSASSCRESDLLGITKTSEWEAKIELMLKTFTRRANVEKQSLVGRLKQFIGLGIQENPPHINLIKHTIISSNSLEKPMAFEAKLSKAITNELIHLFSLPNGKKKIEDIAQYPAFTDYVLDMMLSIGAEVQATGDMVQITKENYDSQVLDMAARYEVSLLSQIFKILKEAKQVKEDGERAALEASKEKVSSETKVEPADAEPTSQEADFSPSGEQIVSQSGPSDL